MCSACSSVFDSLDGIFPARRKVRHHHRQSGQARRAATATAQALLPRRIAIQQRNRDLILSNSPPPSGTNSQSEEALRNATAMGQAFDDAKNDDTFYLPPEAFDNPDFQRGLKLFPVPDGKGRPDDHHHQGVPAFDRGISHIDATARSMRQGPPRCPTPRSTWPEPPPVTRTFRTARSTTHHRRTGGPGADPAHHDVHHPKSGRGGGDRRNGRAVAGGVVRIVGPGVAVHFRHPAVLIIAALAIIPLLAGADYNLLLISRFQEEVDAGLRTGIIRAMGGRHRARRHGGGSGVFAAERRLAVHLCDLVVLGRSAHDHWPGSVVRHPVVRSFMTPSIAAMLGRWFWYCRTHAPGQPNVAGSTAASEKERRRHLICSATSAKKCECTSLRPQSRSENYSTTRSP